MLAMDIYRCLITHLYMTDPVSVNDKNGNTYEREAIE